MFPLDSITSPTLLVDKAKCLSNIKRMAEKALGNNLLFRPHFKTHQSAIIGEWFRGFGVSAITVSSVDMAFYFASHGWKDITIAFPVNLRDINGINLLTEKVDLHLLADSVYTINMLKDNLKHTAGLFIEVDTGSHRSGVNADDLLLINEMLSIAGSSEKLVFRGFLTHAGHTYKARGMKEVEKIHHSSLKIMRGLKKQFLSSNPEMILSIGDTPSCSLMNDFDGIDEIRPGNFVFYDIMQEQIGSCTTGDIAIAMACPVVGTYPARGQIVIYGGAIHFSKDFIKNSRQIFGYMVKLNPQGWIFTGRESFLISLSQEHGIINTTRDFAESIKPGELTGILPVHACLTSNLMRRYLTNEGEVISTMNDHATHN